MTRVLRELINVGYHKWNEAITIITTKAGKKSYNIAKAWRIIHLLPTISKVVDRIILAKMERSITQGTIQNCSQKNHSCHDSVKQVQDFLVYHKYQN